MSPCRHLFCFSIFLYALSFGAQSAQADELAKQAQTLLGNMNYGVGTADGQWGKRSEAAMQAFATKEGYDYAAPIDAADVIALQSAAPKYAAVVTDPTQLFSTTATKLCEGLNDNWPKVDAASLPPFLAFNDSVSIGNSSQKDEMEAWSRAVSTSAAWAAAHPEDQAAFTEAHDLLMSWATFGAGLQTPVDTRYLGHGNGDAYSAEAAAPVLDMQNATRLGSAALYAAVMLKDRLTAEDAKFITAWATALLDKYMPGLTYGVLRNEPLKGVYYGDVPTLMSAIAEGDSERYAAYLKVYFDTYRRNTQPDGAILVNANRGDRALQYQSIGILAMAQTLDLAQSQGTAIPGDIEDLLHRAVKFLLDADLDNSIVMPYAKVRFDNPGDPTQPVRFYRGNSGHYWWMVWYLAHYPDSENAKRLRVFLADYDVDEHVASRVMASTFVPYPVNCFQKFDLSSDAVAAARTYVAENVAAPKPVAAPVKGRGFGIPKVRGALPLSFGKAVVTPGSSDRSTMGFYVALSDLKFGDEAKPSAFFIVQGDFSGPLDQLANLSLLRLRIDRGSLSTPTSREANYAPCGAVAAEVSGSRQEIRLHIGEMSDANACILRKMDPADRRLWGSILTSFEKILKAAPSSASRDKLQQLFDYEVH